MATKRQIAAASRRTPSRTARAAVNWRSRVTKPTVTDPKRRHEVIDRATSRIKTDARIDTITLGRD
jgi:hypothetical protein